MYRIKNDGAVSVYYNQIPIMKNISVNTLIYDILFVYQQT